MFVTLNVNAGPQRSVFDAEVVPATAGQVGRKCVLVQASQFSAALLHDLDEKHAQAIIVVLPAPDSDAQAKQVEHMHVFIS